MAEHQTITIAKIYGDVERVRVTIRDGRRIVSEAELSIENFGLGILGLCQVECVIVKGEGTRKINPPDKSEPGGWRGTGGARV